MDELKLKVSVDDAELDKLQSKTKETLDKARNESESYTDRIKRQAQERTNAFAAENKATLVYLGDQREATIKKINLEEVATQKKLEAAKAEELANAQAGKSKLSLIEIEEKYGKLLALNAQQANQARGAVNTQIDGEIQKANQNFAKATSEVNKTTTAFGQLKSIADPLFKGLNEGNLSLDDLTATFGNATKAAGPYGAILATLVTTLGLLKTQADAAALYQRNIEGAAQASGLAEKTTAGFALQLQRIGESRESAGSTLSQFSQRIEEAKHGSDEALQAFRALKISSQDLINLSPDEILLKISDAYDRLGNTSVRAKATAAIFGDDDAVKFAKIAGGIRAAATEAERLGLVFTPEEKRAVEEYTKAVNEVSIQFERLKLALGKFTLKPAAETISFWVSFFGGPEKIEQDGKAIGQQLAKGIQEGVKNKPGPVSGNSYVSGITASATAVSSPPPLPGRGLGLSDAPRDIAAQIALLQSTTAGGGAGASEAQKKIESLRESQKKLAEQSQENIAVYQQLATALGSTVDQVYVYYQGNLDVVKSEIQKTEQQRKSISAAEDQASAHEKLRKTAESAGLELGKLSAANKTAAESLQAFLEGNVESGKTTRLDALKAITNQVKIQADQELEIRRKQFEAEQGYYKDDEEKRRASAQAFAEFETSINQRKNQAQAALNSEAATVRSRAYTAQTDELKLQEDGLLQKVDKNLREETITAGEAAAQRLAIRTTTISSEIALTEKQLQGENVGYEERQQLEERLRQLKVEFRSEELKGVADLEAAKQQDYEKQIARIQAVQQLESVRDDIRIQKAKEYGADEYQIGILQLQGLQRQLQRLNEVISIKEREKGQEEALLGLTAQREQLEEKIRQSRNALFGGVVAGANAAAGATAQAVDYNTKYSQSFEELQAKALASIKAQKEAGAEAYAGLANLYTFYANRISSIAKLTREETVAEIERLKDDIRGLTAPGGAQIASLLLYFRNQDYDALQAAQRRLDEFNRAEREKQEEETRRANDQARSEAQSLAESIAKDRERIDQQYADRKREIEGELAKIPAERMAEELSLTTRHKEDLTRLDDDFRKRRKEADEAAAREAVRTELELQASLKAARSQARLDGVASANALLASEGQLSAQLFEAQAKGDKEKIKEIQAQLDLLGEKRRLEQKRQNELDAALSSGKSKEEIDAQVESINSRYNAEKEYLDQRYSLLVLRNNATTEEQKRFYSGLLTQLDANFSQQKVLIQERYQEQLDFLKSKNKLEAEERARARQKEEDEYNQQRTDLQKRQAQELSDLRKRFSDRENELKSSLAKEKSAWEQSYSDLEKRTEEAYNKLSDLAKGYFDKVAAGIKGLPTAPAAPGAPTTGSQPSTSTGGGGGGGGSSSTQQSAGGTTTGPTSTTGYQDPKTTPPGGTSTNTAGANQPGSTKNSTQIINDFIAYTDTFDSSKRVQTLAQSLAALDDMLNPRQLPGDARVPIITQADYDRAKAAITAFWTLRNVWDAFRKRQIGAGYVIHLLEEMVEAKLISQAAADPYIKFAKGRIDEFGKEHNNGIPKFNEVPGVPVGLNTTPANLSAPQSDAPGLGSDTPVGDGSDVAPADIREGGLTVPGADFTQNATSSGDRIPRGGGTPQPGKIGGLPFGKQDPTAQPIGGPVRQNPYVRPKFSNQGPGKDRTPAPPGSSTSVFDESRGIALIRQLFQDVIDGKRDTSYAAQALAAWENATPRIISTATYKIALQALEDYARSSRTPTDAVLLLNTFGNGATAGGQNSNGAGTTGGTASGNSVGSTTAGGSTQGFQGGNGFLVSNALTQLTASPLLLEAAKPTTGGGVPGGLTIHLDGELELKIDPEKSARMVGDKVAEQALPLLRRLS